MEKNPRPLPDITVIVPTFNRAAMLRVSIPSILSQSGVKEIVFVDDGSTDGTPGILRNMEEKEDRIRVIRHGKRKGLPTARNTGIDLAQTPYIAFGEDDVVFGENYLSVVLETLIRNGSQFAAGRILRAHPGESIENCQIRCDADSDKPLFDPRSGQWNFGVNPGKEVEVPMLHACAVIERETAARIRYDARYRENAIREESDFYIRAAKQGAKGIFTPHATSYHLREADSGGCRADNRWKHAFWLIANNTRFLARHGEYLRKQGYLNASPLSQAFAYAWGVSKGAIAETIGYRGRSGK